MADDEQTVPQAGPDLARSFTERIYSAAQPGAVFGAPITAGDRTVITASEVSAGGGFGFGQGMGRKVDGNGGGGGGGGGGAQGRPVAVISIGPDGVQIKPIVDVSKLALAAVTAWAAVAATAWRLRRRRRS